MTKLPFFLVLPLSGLAAFAEAQNASNNSYQFEFGATYSTSDADFITKSNNYSVDGTYYFAPVQLKDNPYAEAAFMERAGFVSLGGGYGENETKTACVSAASGTGRTSCRTGQEGSSAGVTTGFYVADIFYFEGSYSYSDNENKYNGRTFSSNNDYWSAAIGIAPMENMLLTTSFAEGNDLFGDNYNISGKYVIPFTSGQALNLEASYAYYKDAPDIADDDDWIVGGDYYFSRAFSVGGTFNSSDNYTLRSRYFFNQALSLDVEYSEQRDFLDIDTYSVGLSARF
ncbi:putative porin [Gilvimarinus chinensis]|uniref:putative porin n=1 Tax=Gilvimarinus chinensis TaxID=396005 RepID=UPI00036AE9E4|nr:putative porin [Gilvimarinus chinensis]